MDQGYYVELGVIIKEFNLKVIRGCANYERVRIRRSSITRPGLQLVGFYDYFDSDLVQLLGMMEWTYLTGLSSEERQKRFDDLFSRPVPAVIVARNLDIFPECLAAAEKYNRVLLQSDQNTGVLQTTLITSLTRYLSPRITRHGVLVEVYGEGLLLMGDSGVGKSETALELLKRGHRLIADDAVEIRKVSETSLIGTAPELIRNYIELRGIGIVNVAKLFGMGAVRSENEINLVVNIVPWNTQAAYDRLGLEDQYMDILGVKVPMNTIPVTAGRNLAVILEVAAMNNRQRKLGYNAAQEFSDRIDRHFEMNTERK